MESGREMTCEWDRLMELPKEELVIELVRARTRFDTFVSTMIEFSKNPNHMAIQDIGFVPSEEWLKTIIDYAKKQDPDFDVLDLVTYGVDFDIVSELNMEEE